MLTRAENEKPSHVISKYTHIYTFECARVCARIHTHQLSHISYQFLKPCDQGHSEFIDLVFLCSHICPLPLLFEDNFIFFAMKRLCFLVECIPHLDDAVESSPHLVKHHIPNVRGSLEAENLRRHW